MIEATAELLNDMLDVSTPTPAKAGEIPVLGLAADGAPDVLALRMLGRLLLDTPFALDIRDRSVLSTEIVESVKAGRYCAVCIADIPPSAPSRSRGASARWLPMCPSWSGAGCRPSLPTSPTKRCSPPGRPASPRAS